MRVLQVGSGKRRFPFASVIALFLIFGTLSVLPQTAWAAYYKVTYSGGTATWETGSAPYSLNNGWWSGSAAPSSSPRFNAFASCTGAITTTFTWTPSYMGDPAQPPTKAVIYQEATATVSGSGSGTVNDGLGGSGGVGKRFAIKDSPGPSFTLATVSPSATIGAFSYGVAIAGVKYLASASPLEISLAGGIGLNNAKRYLMGQQVTASLVPGGLIPTSYNWTAAGGSPFKNWTANNNTATFTALSIETNSTFVFNFKKYQQQAVVTCTTHLSVPQGILPANGFDVTVNRECNVERPDSAVIGISIGTVTPQPPVSPTFVELLGAPSRPDVGMEFEGQITTPNDFVLVYGNSGDWNWTQLITPYDQRKRNGIWQKIALSLPPPANPPYRIIYGLQCLDNTYPYDGWYIANGVSAGSNDSPLEPLEADSAITAKDLLDSFDCWFMYRPPGAGSIAVPMRKLGWFWEFHASKANSVWSVANTLAQWGMGAEYPDHPLWSFSLSNGAIIYVAP